MPPQNHHAPAPRFKTTYRPPKQNLTSEQRTKQRAVFVGQEFNTGPWDHQVAPASSAARARVVLCGAGSWAQGWHLPQLQRASQIGAPALFFRRCPPLAEERCAIFPNLPLLDYFFIRGLNQMEDLLTSSRSRGCYDKSPLLGDPFQLGALPAFGIMVKFEELIIRSKYLRTSIRKQGTPQFMGVKISGTSPFSPLAAAPKKFDC